MMSGLVPLGQIAGNTGLIIDGDWVESKDQDPDGEVRLVQLADIGVGSFLDKSNRFMAAEKAVKLKCTYLEEGDILVARMPDPLGRACQFPGDGRKCVTVVDVCILRPDDAVADAAYVTHILNSDGVRRQLDKFIKGTTRQRISRTNLEQIRIPLPPLPEQRRIAAILDQADAIRAKRREALAQLDSLTQSIFIEMFGDPEANPNGLPVANLEELCLRVTDGTHQSPKWESEGIPFLFISNIVDGEITYKTDKFISRETYTELTRRCRIETGDVLFTTVGSYGNTAVVSGEREFCFQRHIAHIKPNTKKLAPLFCAAMLESPGVRRQVDKAARGVAQKTVNLADLKALRVFAPSTDMQRDFTDKLNTIKTLKVIQVEALQKLDALFASLQHRAFLGEL